MNKLCAFAVLLCALFTGGNRLAGSLRHHEFMIALHYSPFSLHTASLFLAPNTTPTRSIIPILSITRTLTVVDGGDGVPAMGKPVFLSNNNNHVSSNLS